MRTIDADALEKDGWQMTRTVRVDKDTMEWQTRKPTDFPAIEPQRMCGRWIGCGNSDHWKCSVCGTRAAFWFSEESSSEVDLDMSEWLSDYCPNCGSYNGGADMRGTE